MEYENDADIAAAVAAAVAVAAAATHLMMSPPTMNVR